MMDAPMVYNQDESPLIISCQTNEGSIFHNYTVALGDSDASGINGQEIFVTESSCSRTDFSSSTISTQTEDSSSTILSRSTISCDSSLGSQTKISAEIPSVQLYDHTVLQTLCQESSAKSGETKLRPLPRPPTKKKSLPLQECSRTNKLYELSKIKQDEGKKRREQIAHERAKNIEKKKLDITRLRNETTAAGVTKLSTTVKSQPKVSSSLKKVEGCPRTSRLYGLSKNKQNDGKKRREEIALASDKKNALPENDGKKISLSKVEEMYQRGIKALREKEIRMAELKEKQERARYELNPAKDSIAN